MLLEVGFQAGQHEILADAFSKEIAQQIYEKAKEMKETRRKNMKQSKKILDELNASFKSMTASKDKFRRAYAEQVSATQTYQKVIFFENFFKNYDATRCECPIWCKGHFPIPAGPRVGTRNRDMHFL